MALANLLTNLGSYYLGKNLPSIYKNLKTASTAGSGSGITTTYPNTTNTTTTTLPTAPNLNLETPDVEYPDWQSAYEKAKSIYDPQYKSAELSQNQLTRDQQKSLVQGLSAKGYSNLRGGQRIVGEGNITQDQAAKLEDLKNKYDSYTNEFATQLYTGESATATSKLNSLLADRDAKNNLALSKYQTDLSAALQKEINENNKYNGFVKMLYSLFPDDEE